MQEENFTNTSTFIKNLPKVELHAHLNGSLSPKTLENLIALKRERRGINSVANMDQFAVTSNLSECFKMFSIIHSVTDCPESIFMATCDVIKDFYEDSVYYLELRSTPREIENSMSRSLYVETILAAIEKTVSNSCPGMTVKLILSIDRRNSKLAAEETVKIAYEKLISSSTIVGIDLSGDPRCGDISLILPVLKYAQTVGLKLVLHVSEVPGSETEVEQLLRLNPYRIGHGTYLHPKTGGSEQNFKLLTDRKIPLEICLTSNVISKTVKSYEDHHFQHFREISHPCVLCTDDKGVFQTTLSEEYSLAQKYFHLSVEELYQLSYDSINYICASNEEKRALKDHWSSAKESHVFCNPNIK